MKFSFKRRAAEFGTFANKIENRNSDKKHKAIDLPLRFLLKPRELDMVVPSQGVPLSEFLLGSNLRKPALQTSVLVKIPVARLPTINLSLFDTVGKTAKPLDFQEVMVKQPVIVIEPADQSIWLKAVLKIIPGRNLQRISDNVEDQTIDFECVESAPELFDQEGAEEEDEGGGEQTELMGNPDEDSDED